MTAPSSLTWQQQNYASRIKVDGRWFHPEAKHGTYGGYTNYGCRCLPCTGANTTAQRKKRRGRRAAAARAKAATVRAAA